MVVVVGISLSECWDLLPQKPRILLYFFSCYFDNLNFSVIENEMACMDKILKIMSLSCVHSLDVVC